MTDDPMLAPCGLNCAECAIYLAAQDPEEAARMTEAWRESGYEAAQPEWFRCQGCRGDKTVRWGGDCRIAGCCEKKALHTCGQCGEFPCVPYAEWAVKGQHHQEAHERLKGMAQQGGNGCCGTPHCCQ